MVEKLSKRTHHDDNSDDEEAIKAARQAAIRERQNRKKRKLQAGGAADDFEVVPDGEQPKKAPVAQPENDDNSDKPGKASAKSKSKKQKTKQKPVEAEKEGGQEGNGEENSDAKADSNRSEGLADVFKKLLSSGGPVTEEAPILIKDRRQEKKLEEEKEIAKTKRLAAAERRQEEDKGHVIPDVSTKNYERGLSKIATSGVVKLFNAVRKQQKQLEGELESVTLEAKKEKVTSQVLSKGSFLELLKKTPAPAVTAPGGGATASFKFDIGGKTDEGDSKPKGSWLKSDYMMGAKMKDWDKQEDGEEEDMDEEEMEFDDEDDE